MTNKNFLQQTATDYGLELWQVKRLYDRCYDYEKCEHDLVLFYEYLEEQITEREQPEQIIRPFGCVIM